MSRKPLGAPHARASRRPSRMAPGGRVWAESPVRSRGVLGLGDTTEIWVDQPLSPWGGDPDTAVTISGPTNTEISTGEFTVRLQFATPPVEPVIIEVWNAAGGSVYATATLVDGWWVATFPAYGPVTGDTRITVFNDGAYATLTDAQIVTGVPPAPPPPAPGEIVWGGPYTGSGGGSAPVEGGDLTVDEGYATEFAWVDGRTLSAADSAVSEDLLVMPSRSLFASDIATAADTRLSEPTQSTDAATALDRVFARDISAGELLRGSEGAGGIPPGLIAQISVSALPSLSDMSVITSTVEDLSGAGNSGTPIGSLLYRTNLTPNGSPALSSTLDGYLQLPSTMWAGKRAAHLFIYVNAVPTYRPINGTWINYGPWWMGYVPGGYSPVRTEYPYVYYSSQSLYDSSFRTYLSGGSIFPAPDSVLDRWHIYESSIGVTNSFSRLDGGTKSTSSYAFTEPVGPYYLLRGAYTGMFHVAEFLAFDRTLTDAEAESVRGYLRTKFGLLGAGLADTGTAAEAASITFGGFSSTDTANAVDAVYLPSRILTATETAFARDSIPGLLYSDDSAQASEGVVAAEITSVDAGLLLAEQPQEFLRETFTDSAVGADLVRQTDPDLTEKYDFDGANSGESQLMVPTLLGTEVGLAVEGYVDAVIDVISFSDGVLPPSVTVSDHVSLVPATAPSGGTPPGSWVVRLDGAHEDSTTRSLTLSLAGHETPATRVRFWHSTSSENQFDRGQALFPGQPTYVQVSGLQRWVQYLSPPVPDGVSSALWRYVKDAGMFGGEDSYYLGHIEILGHVDVQQRRTAGDTGAGAEGASTQEDAYYLTETASLLDEAGALIVEVSAADVGAGIEGYVETTWRTYDFTTIPEDLVAKSWMGSDITAQPTPGPPPTVTVGDGSPNNLSRQAYPPSGVSGSVSPTPSAILRIGSDVSGYGASSYWWGFALPLTQPTTTVRFWHALNSYSSTTYTWYGYSTYDDWATNATSIVEGGVSGDITWRQASVSVPSTATTYQWRAKAGYFVSSTATEGYCLALIEFRSPIIVTPDKFDSDSAVAVDIVSPIIGPDSGSGEDIVQEFSMTSGDDWLRAPDISGDLDRDSVPDSAQAVDGNEVIVADGMTLLWSADAATAVEGGPRWLLEDMDTLTDAVSARSLAAADTGSTVEGQVRASTDPYDFEEGTAVETAVITALEHTDFDNGQASEGYGPEMGASTVVIDLTDGLWHGQFTPNSGSVTIVPYDTAPMGGAITDPPTQMVRFNGAALGDYRLTLDANPWRATQIRFWIGQNSYYYGRSMQGSNDGFATTLYSITNAYDVYQYPWTQRTESLLPGAAAFTWRFSVTSTTTPIGTNSHYLGKIELLNCSPIPVTVVTDSDSATAVEDIAPNEYMVGADTGSHADAVGARAVERTDTAAGTDTALLLAQLKVDADTGSGLDVVNLYEPGSSDTALGYEVISDAYAPTSEVGLASEEISERDIAVSEAGTSAEAFALTSPDLNYVDTYTLTYGTGFAPAASESGAAADAVTDRAMVTTDPAYRDEYLDAHTEGYGTPQDYSASGVDEAGAHATETASGTDEALFVGIRLVETGSADDTSLTRTLETTEVVTSTEAPSLVVTQTATEAATSMDGATPANLLPPPETGTAVDVVVADRDLAGADRDEFPYWMRMTSAYGATGISAEAAALTAEQTDPDTGTGAEDATKEEL